MFFALSKILFFLVTPSNIVWMLIALGLVLLWRGRTRSAGRLVAAGLGLLLLLGFSPIGNVVIYPLEERFARPAADVTDPAGLGPIEGIIVLGGFEDGRIATGRGLLGLNEAGERLAETVRLAVKLRRAKVVFTGGVGVLMLSAEDAAVPVGDYLASVGIERARIVLEAKSRNTWENAVFTRALLQPRPGQRYLLVTSAWHMPRSMGVFRQAGFEVIPWSVDYRTRGPDDLWRPFGGIYNGLERVDTAVKEWIGLVAYYLTGRSNAIWPGPVAARRGAFGPSPMLRTRSA